MEQIELFTDREVNKSKREPNPMIHVHGIGPEGTKCRYCEHFGYKHFAKKYYKCELRGTKGASTDHSYYFPSCGKFKEADEK